MTDDERPDGWLTTRRLVAVGLVIGLVTGFSVAATIGGEPATPISGGVPLGASDGPTVTVYGDTNASLGNFTDDANTVNVTTNGANITLSSTGQTSAAVYPGRNLTGTWTNVTDITAGGTELTIDPADKPAVRVLGDADQLSIRDGLALDDGTVDLAVAGPNGGVGTLTLTQGWGLPAGKQVAAVDVDTTRVLDVATTNSSGTLTLDIPLSSHNVTLQTSAGGPTLSDPQPDTLVSTPPGSVSINVSDPDFPGDNVTVNFTVDNSTVGSDYVTSNGTASVSITPSNYGGGVHNVSATATDAYGQTATRNWTFKVPDTLFVYNESDPSQLVTGATVDVRFYYRNGSTLTYVTRSTSDGKVNLTGLPVANPLTAAVRVDGYYNRRVFLRSLYKQQKIYVLPESKQASTVKFELRDFTGRFPQDNSVLIIQRGLNGSFQTVQADFLGANNELPTTLRYNRRHTLTLYNVETGATRNLGTYTPLSSGEQTVTVAVEGDIQVTGVESISSIEPAARRLPAQNVTVRVRLTNQSGVDEYRVRGIVSHNGTNTTVFNVTRQQAGVVTQNVSLGNYSDGELRVETSYVANGGDVTGQKTATFPVTSSTSGRTGTSLLGALGALVALVPVGNQAGFTTAAALMTSLLGTLALASRYRLPTELSGVVGALWLTGFAILGWIDYTLLFVVGVLIAALVIIRQVV